MVPSSTCFTVVGLMGQKKLLPLLLAHYLVRKSFRLINAFMAWAATAPLICSAGAELQCTGQQHSTVEEHEHTQPSHASKHEVPV